MTSFGSVISGRGSSRRWYSDGLAWEDMPTDNILVEVKHEKKLANPDRVENNDD